jgi:methionyl aminopeptidase
MKIKIKTKREIDIMRRNGHILALILKELKKIAKPGVSGETLENLANKLIKEFGGTPSFKGFGGYPASLCFSINEEIVHAIPREDKIIREGDLVSLDLGFYKNRFHSDSAISFAIPSTNKDVLRLLNTTKKALYSAIENIRPGIRLGKISAVIEKTIEERGLSVIKELTGHGVGRNLHEEPCVLNYSSDKLGPLLEQGMVLAIEPMASLGSDRIKKGNDGYAYETKDRSLSAHFEHTVAITKNGCEILTQ